MAVQTLHVAAEDESVNPYDGKTLKTFVEITDEQLESKLAAAQTCYEMWRLKTYAQRAAIVAKAAAIMHELFDVVANCVTIRGSFVGNRQDMAETLAIADEGKVRADIELEPLGSINSVIDRLKRGAVAGRVVIEYAAVKSIRSDTIVQRGEEASDDRTTAEFSRKRAGIHL